MSDHTAKNVCSACLFDTLPNGGQPRCRTRDRLDISRLAKTWLDHHRLSFGQHSNHEQADRLFWAWECLVHLTDAQPETALDVILEAMELAKDESEIAALAAGPMETLIAHNGERVICRIEEVAWRKPAFRRLLMGVWSQGTDATEVWQRVLRARAGGRPAWLPTKRRKRGKRESER